jgi:hypothetical protein
MKNRNKIFDIAKDKSSCYRLLSTTGCCQQIKCCFYKLTISFHFPLFFFISGVYLTMHFEYYAFVALFLANNS